MTNSQNTPEIQEAPLEEPVNPFPLPGGFRSTDLLHVFQRSDGMMFHGREGQSFESIIEEYEATSTSVPSLSYQPPLPTSADVNVERERRIALPLVVTVTGLGSFPIDMGGTSQRNLNGLASAAILRTLQGDTTAVIFRDANNFDQILTPQQVLQMALQAAARIDAVYKQSWAIKAMELIPVDYTSDQHWN